MGLRCRDTLQSPLSLQVCTSPSSNGVTLKPDPRELERGLRMQQALSVCGVLWDLSATPVCPLLTLGKAG